MRNFSDKNAPEVYGNLRKIGWSVAIIRHANNDSIGVSDAVVARTPGRCHLLEVKRRGGSLNENQVNFSGKWRGCYHVATSSWEANLLLEECERRAA